MTTDTAIKMIRVGVDAAEGHVDPISVARAAMALALEFVPVEELRKYLDEAATNRADLVADLAETAKFGPR